MKDFLKNDRFAALAGVELLEAEKGYAKARMLITPDHLNAVGVCRVELSSRLQIWFLPLWLTTKRHRLFPYQPISPTYVL